MNMIHVGGAIGAARITLSGRWRAGEFRPGQQPIVHVTALQRGSWRAEGEPNQPQGIALDDWGGRRDVALAGNVFNKHEKKRGG